MKHFVYSFNEGSKDMRGLLGGKGANLAEMTKIGPGTFRIHNNNRGLQRVLSQRM